jgi:hypothetical protein
MAIANVFRKFSRWAIPLLLVASLLPATTATPSHAQDDLCATLPPSQLTAGGFANVVGANSLKIPGAYLKPEASRKGPVLRYLPTGTVVSLEETTQCTADGDRWWRVKIGDLSGWMTESTGPSYVLEPAPDAGTPPFASTIAKRLDCIVPQLPSAETPAPAADGAGVFRVAYGGDDGGLYYSDNLGPTRVVAQFNPPPLSVDLSPDGSAALVVTYNGVYWVDLLSGQTVLLADGLTFGLAEESWPRRAQWLPSGTAASVEIEDTRDDIYSYPVWNLPIDGLTEPYQVDRGNQPINSVRRTPARDAMILLSANDILPYPRNFNDEPEPLLKFVPRIDIGDARALLPPAISWNSDGTGFYTFIPISESAPPDDAVGGHLWFVGLDGRLQDLGLLPNVDPAEYVIPAPDGEHILLGAGSGWRIQLPKTGEVVNDLPPLQYLFNWTPDSKGVVFTNRDASIGYLGTDGATESPFVPPAANNLFEIRWLPNGTTLYAVRGSDGRLSFSVQVAGQESVFVGIPASVYAFDGQLYSKAPGFGKAPQACGGQ